jgi:hypothetical protein
MQESKIKENALDKLLLLCRSAVQGRRRLRGARRLTVSAGEGEDMPPPATPASGAAATAMRPCLRTHGKQVARLHLFDWVVLLLLVAMYAVLGMVPAVPPVRRRGHDGEPPVPDEGQHRAQLGRAGTPLHHIFMIWKRSYACSGFHAYISQKMKLELRFLLSRNELWLFSNL